MRIKVQLLFLFFFVALVGAAPAGAAQYTVVTCNGQAAATGGWTLFASGPNTALSENCAASGGSMAAVLAGNQAPAASNAGWQVSAPANTTFAGATLYRKVGVAGTGYGYVARGITPAAANYQVFETCSGPADCKQEIARASVAWISARADVNRLQVYVQCPSTACQKLNGGEAAAVRISRADIVLNDNAAPTISAGPTSAMFGSGAAVSGVQSIAVDLQGPRRRRGGDGRAGRRADGLRDARPQRRLPHALSPARAVPADVAATLQFNPASVPDGPHQVRVFARDATGTNVGYSASFPVTTSARGAVNGTNGSDQVKLSRRRAPGRERRAPRADAAHDARRALQRQDRRAGAAGQQRRPARHRGPADGRHGGRPRRADLRGPAHRRGHRRQRAASR